MRIISLAIILIVCLETSAQKKQEELYYFMTKDSLVGVKKGSAEALIKPRRLGYYWYLIDELKKPIKENLIYLDADMTDIYEPHSCGVIYNRKGELLFAPFMFENGPEGYVEGLQRIVKNGKVGFANRNGDIVIQPKYDYAGMFNYGIAPYCNDCVWKYEGEHGYPSGGTWGYINNAGATIDVMPAKKNGKDQKLDSARFLPYQFSYSKFEQRIIDSFNKLTEIRRASFVNYYSLLDSSERILHYEIVERPSSFFPYYYIATFSYSKKYGYSGNPFFGPNFYVTRKGDQFFYDDAGELIPLRSWLKKYIKNAKEYLKTHPDANNKF